MSMKWMMGWIFMFVILTVIGQITEGGFGSSSIMTFQTATEHFSMISTTDFLGSITNIIKGFGDIAVAFFNMMIFNYTYMAQGPMEIVKWIMICMGVGIFTYFLIDIKTSV